MEEDQRDRDSPLGRLLLPGIVIGVAGLRWGLLDVPLERDEGEYAYTAQLLLEGIPPYAQAYNMKMPGIYAAYAAILATLGETPRGIHLALLLLNGWTIWLVARLGRRLFDEQVGLASGAAFGVLSLGSTVQGLWANAEVFVLPFALAGILMTLRGRTSDGVRPFATAGLLLGIAFLMKQHAVFFMILCGVVAFDAAIRSSGKARRERCWQWAVLVAAALSPYALTCLALWSLGHFETFWFWTVEYARVYSGLIPVSEGPGRFLSRLREVSGGARALWGLSAFGISALFWWRGGLKDGWKGARDSRVFTLLFLVASLGALVPGLYFRPHYFVLLLPVAALLAGVGARAAGDVLANLAPASAGRIRGFVPGGLVALAIVQALSNQASPLFQWSPAEVTRSVYGLSPFPESVVVGEWLREVAAPGDRVAILGSEPQIAFYSGLRKASGYLYVYPLMESHRYAEEMQRGMIREIEASAPRFLVFVNVPSSWQRRPDSRTELLEWLDGYIRDFQLVGRVAIQREGTLYLRGDELSPTSSCASNCLEVFERLLGR